MRIGFAPRLALWISGLVAVACVSVGWLLLRRDLVELARALVDRGQAVSAYLARESELAMLSGNLEALRQLASSARAQRDVVYCRFVDAAGVDLLTVGDPPVRPVPAPASNPPASVVDQAEVWEFRSAIHTTVVQRQREELGFSQDDADGPGRPAARRERIGTAVVGLALGPLVAHRERVIGTAAFVTLVVIAVAVVSAAILARAMTRPLKALARAADAVAQGRLDTAVTVRSGDEVGALAASFNAMARSVAQSRASIEEANRTLEAKVQARTERLESLNRQLVEADRLKLDFLATVSHELRTPINVILGYAELLADGAMGAVTPEQVETLQTIQRYSALQRDLITSVMDFSRLTSGRITVTVERFALRSLVADVCGLHHRRADTGEVRVVADVADDLPDFETDRVKVQEIVRNLVDNAVKFTTWGTISVTAHPGPDPGWATIIVHDTGQGIAPDELPHIFDDFRQAGTNDTRETSGVGLGLAIVKRLVHVLGGTISVHSRLGEGTTFRVVLPLRHVPVSPGVAA